MIPALLQFVGLVLATCVVFFTVPRRFRPHVLAAAGVLFYVLYSAGTLWVVAAVILGTYLWAGTAATGLVVAGLALLLVFFKLPGGMAGALPMLSAAGSGDARMPLGFSFLVFELIHYAVERRRGRLAGGSFVDLAAFSFFFPCRVAGPIKRYPDFTAAVAAAELSPENVNRGCLRIAGGLIKKVLLADGLQRWSGGLAAATTPAGAWTAAVAYSFQLYFDFSAYSDIAIGTSQLMGIRVPENFDWPYLSANIQDFWNRWHMSLSSWVRDYIFLTLGRRLFKTSLRRSPRIISTLSYLVTFFTVGAWHGLSSNFLLWGVYHGVLLSGFQIVKTTIPLGVAMSPVYRSRAATWAATALTFLLVTVGWVIFQLAPTQAWHTIRLMTTGR